MTEETNELVENWRNPDGTFKSGHPDYKAGRPKGKTLKEFAREWFALSSDKAKKEYLNKLDPSFVWRMAEGNPANDLQVEGKVKHIFYMPTELLEKHDLPQITESDSAGQA